MARGDAPDINAPDMMSSDIIQRILRRGRNEQEPSAKAATVADESPTAMPQKVMMPRIPAEPAPEAPTINPASRPSLSDRDMGAMPPTTGGTLASPAAPEVDTEGMPTFDADQPQKWRGEGDYYYSYKPATGSQPATITFHGGANRRRAPLTISETGSQAAAFAAILEEARRLNAEGRAEPYKTADQYAKEQGETTNQTVERVAQDLMPREEASVALPSQRDTATTAEASVPTNNTDTFPLYDERGEIMPRYDEAGNIIPGSMVRVGAVDPNSPIYDSEGTVIPRSLLRARAKQFSKGETTDQTIQRAANELMPNRRMTTEEIQASQRNAFTPEQMRTSQIAYQRAMDEAARVRQEAEGMRQTDQTMKKQALINRINNAVATGDNETARQAAYELSSQFSYDADAQNYARRIIMGQ